MSSDLLHAQLNVFEERVCLKKHRLMPVAINFHNLVCCFS